MAKSIELAYLRASTQQRTTRDILRSRPSVFMGLHATDLSQLVRFGGRPGILIERIHDNSMLDAILASEDDIANNVVDSAVLHASESPAGSGTPVDVAHPGHPATHTEQKTRAGSLHTVQGGGASRSISYRSIAAVTTSALSVPCCARDLKTATTMCAESTSKNDRSASLVSLLP